MKKLIVFLSIAAVIVSCVGILAFASMDAERTVEIVKDGEAEYGITYSGFWTQSSSSRLEVPEAFRDALKKATGAEPELYIGEQEQRDKEIFIGNTSTVIGKVKDRVSEGGIYKVDEELLGVNGFVITSTDNRYILCASDAMGAWNAALYFFNECLGYDLLDHPEGTVASLSAPKNIHVISSEYLKCYDEVVIDIDGTDIGEYTVIYPADASDKVKEYAMNIRRYIFAMTGKDIPMADDSSEAKDCEIVIGKTARYDAGDLGEKGYTLKSEGKKIIIAGSGDFATGIAVDAFASEYLGIKNGKYEGQSVLHIPGGIDLRSESAFAYTVTDGIDYSDYIRDNIDALAEPDGTPCFSDKALEDKLYDALKETEDGEAFVVCNRADWCGCDNCKGETKAYSEMLNSLADRLAKDGITLSTVAINETRKPALEKYSDNLKVYFAEPYLCCAHGIGDATCEVNKGAGEDLAAWTKACGNVAVLDFTMNYHSFPSTFPNFAQIYKNIHFYYENGVKSVLMAWNRNSAALEFGQIRTALLDAVLADPDMTEEEYGKLYDSTIEALYGTSAEAIKSYIEKFTAASAVHFNIFTKPEELLPIKKDPSKSGAEAYDLTLAKELANIWEGIYKRHEVPETPYYGLEMYAFNKAYIESDYYLQLHSRVQFTEWLNANIPAADRNGAYTDIIATFEQ